MFNVDCSLDEAIAQIDKEGHRQQPTFRKSGPQGDSAGNLMSGGCFRNDGHVLLYT